MATCCSDRFLGPQMNNILLAVGDALDECNVGACRAFLSTAPQVPWDNCCECSDGSGQLWVSVSSITPLNTPTSGPSPIRCATWFEATLNVGLMRCALTLNDSGNPPAADALSLEALAALRDRVILLQGIRNWAESNNIELDDWTIQGWESLAGGGCLGGVHTLLYRFRSDLCC